MRLYQVQLETPKETFQYEVATDDFDAVTLARAHLAGLVDKEAAQRARVGGYDDLGVAKKAGVTLCLRK